MSISGDTGSGVRELRERLLAMASQMNDLKEIVDKLAVEPLTHLMLGHRELFHSNLLAWFFECLQEESDNVFWRLTETNTTETGEVRKVSREKNHFDLSFHWPNLRPLVIENKVFNRPDKEQLIKYTREIATRVGNASLCLLSLTNPNWENDRLEIDHHKWCWLSFRKLAELIRSALPADNPSYEVDPMRHYSVETMRHYAEVVDLLHTLAARVAVKDSNETVRLPDDLKKALDDSRLTSSMAKLRASSVEQSVRRALRVARVAQTNVETNMTRSQPLIEWFCSISDEWEAGWQVQHDQFRLAIRMKKGDGARPQHVDFARNKQHLFNFANLDDKLGTIDKTTYPNKKLEFCYYNPGFIYRYMKVPDLTVSQLEAAAVAVARRPVS
jgi:hypothetical protein